MSLLTYGLLFATMGIPILIEAAIGGWKFGDLLRCLDLTMAPSDWPAFYERLQQRLAELRFTPTGNAGEYVQRGQTVTDLGAFTHAKTPKMLRITMDSVASETNVQLTLHYLDGIVADTGESAYRDAVLDYVSGQSDEMKVVPNRSYLAICAFAGGIVAWLVLAVSAVIGRMNLLQTVYALGATYTLLGAYAVFAIIRKKGQTVGLPWAIIGTVASGLALLGAMGLKFLHTH